MARYVEERSEFDAPTRSAVLRRGFGGCSDGDGGWGVKRSLTKPVEPVVAALCLTVTQVSVSDAVLMQTRYCHGQRRLIGSVLGVNLYTSVSL